MSEQKFPIGSYVKVVRAGRGFRPNEIGMVYQITDYNVSAYCGSPGYRVNGHENSGVNDYHGEESFELFDPHYRVEFDDSNLKLISILVPKEYKWMAMDSDGEWYIYIDKPEIEQNIFTLDAEGSEKTKILVQIDPKDIEVDWKDTLHEI